MTERKVTYALILDDRKRPARWTHIRDLGAASSLATAGKPLGDLVSLQSTLQDALEAMLVEGGAVPVTGARGEYAGMIELDTVIATIQRLREEHTES
jgi:osmoprotectant transport system ATP-binding protein